MALLHGTPGRVPDDMTGAKIFRDVLPPSSGTGRHAPVLEEFPFGDGFPNDESNGNHHQWQVWSLWKDYPEYEKTTPGL